MIEWGIIYSRKEKGSYLLENKQWKLYDPNDVLENLL